MKAIFASAIPNLTADTIETLSLMYKQLSDRALVENNLRCYFTAMISHITLERMRDGFDYRFTKHLTYFIKVENSDSVADIVEYYNQITQIGPARA